MAGLSRRKGDLVGSRFLLEEQVGTGSFGSVWSATDLEMPHQRVAVKMLYPHRRDHRTLQRFAQEAKILRDVEHPNVARLIAFGEDGEDLFLAMELIEGEPLKQRLDTHAASGRLVPIQAASWICDQLARALSHLHARGIIHRDLKPRNVLVNRRGQPSLLKVLDFGVAKMLVGSIVEPTTAGRMMGSLAYVAPEQLLGQRIDSRADIFSLGTMLFEVLTLHRPWLVDETDRPLPWLQGTGNPIMNNHLAISQRITAGTRPRITDLRPDLSPRVDEIFARATAVDERARHVSVDAFAQEMRDALFASRHGLADYD